MVAPHGFATNLCPASCRECARRASGAELQVSRFGGGGAAALPCAAAAAQLPTRNQGTIRTPVPSVLGWRRCCRTALRRRSGAATNQKSGHDPDFGTVRTWVEAVPPHRPAPPQRRSHQPETRARSEHRYCSGLGWRRCCCTALRRRSGAATNQKSGPDPDSGRGMPRLHPGRTHGSAQTAPSKSGEPVVGMAGPGAATSLNT